MNANKDFDGYLAKRFREKPDRLSEIREKIDEFQELMKIQSGNGSTVPYPFYLDLLWRCAHDEHVMTQEDLDLARVEVLFAFGREDFRRCLFCLELLDASVRQQGLPFAEWEFMEATALTTA